MESVALGLIYCALISQLSESAALVANLLFA